MLAAPLMAVMGMPGLDSLTLVKDKDKPNTNRGNKWSFGDDLILFETHVAGIAYYKADVVRHTLRRGQKLFLRREPHNQYDEQAIEVFSKSGAKLGYVPRHRNETIASLMDNGRTIFAKVTKVDTGHWNDIRVELILCNGKNRNAV